MLVIALVAEVRCGGVARVVRAVLHTPTTCYPNTIDTHALHKSGDLHRVSGLLPATVTGSFAYRLTMAQCIMSAPDK